MITMAAEQGLQTKPVTMVLVTDQFQCERLITAGRMLADKRHTDLSVIHVEAAGAERNPEAIEYLFHISKENDALMMIYFSDQPAKQIMELIRDNAPVQVVSGLPQQKNSLLHKIWTRFSSVDFFVVDHNGTPCPITLKDRVAT